MKSSCIGDKTRSKTFGSNDNANIEPLRFPREYFVWGLLESIASPRGKHDMTCDEMNSTAPPGGSKVVVMFTLHTFDIVSHVTYRIHRPDSFTDPSGA